MPTAEAPGKLKNRDDKKLINTDKEKVSKPFVWVNKQTAHLNLDYSQMYNKTGQNRAYLLKSCWNLNK